MDEALRLAREIAEALAYAHRQGIVHRDIKPANILLSEGHALVADFGIARAVGEGGGEALTKTGLAVGTPQYMAPEQATAEKDVDGRADIYAIGAMLYEMLAGEPPFVGPECADHPDPEPHRGAAHADRGARRDCRSAVDSVVQKALAKNPVDRYATGEALIGAIDGMRQVGMSSGSSPSVTAPATEVVPASAKTASAAMDAMPKKLVLACATCVIAGVAAAGVVGDRCHGHGGAGGKDGHGGRRGEREQPHRGAAVREPGCHDRRVLRRRHRRRGAGQVVAGERARDHRIVEPPEYKGSNKGRQDIAKRTWRRLPAGGEVRWAGPARTASGGCRWCRN